MKVKLNKIKQTINEKGKNKVTTIDEIAFHLLKNGFRKISHFTYIYEFNISGRTISYISVELKDKNYYIVKHDNKKIEGRGDIDNIINDMNKILEGENIDISNV